jgi:hypothetical protein
MGVTPTGSILDLFAEDASTFEVGHSPRKSNGKLFGDVGGTLKSLSPLLHLTVYFQARTWSFAREKVTASTGTGHGGPTFLNMAPDAGATYSKSATGRSNGASSISTRITLAKTQRAIPGSIRNKARRKRKYKRGGNR